ncbi:MAG: hypothetical protein V4707_00685 [Pseudomonadota bacterium]
MSRFLAVLAPAALLLSACASGPLPAQGDGAPPWASLTSPTAALKVVLDEVCLPAVMHGRPVAELAEARYMVSVPVRSTGSPMAVAAWRLGSWHDVYVMELPNGGCSASLEAGDAAGLATAAIEMLKTHGTFAAGDSMPARDGEAENTAWCTPEADRPVVVGVLRKIRGRGPALLVNVFRAQGARPPFCPRA